MEKKLTDKQIEGLKIMNAVYAQDFAARITKIETPLLADTVEHLFGDIWNRPDLAIRDRRLLVMGVTAALGRADLIKIQVGGALSNGELSPIELREAVLHLAYYVGWGNATAISQGVEEAINEFTKK